ncbi:MAG TPA: phosphoribosylglycinamide formyltransferase [Thermoplasmata archaeon]|nr:phosphoribosylglycinamide formyltransferase [Thermoplasmata archaeon]
MPRTIRLAVFVSGEGTTLDGLGEAIDTGRLPAQIGVVVADRPDIGALDRAHRRGLPTVVVPLSDRGSAEGPRRLDRELEAHRTELVVLAGFLSILPKDWLDQWAGRVINVHPALLPKFGGRGFYGRRVHEAVLASGDRETGATVHLVTAAIDGGPILAQRRLEVRSEDTPESLRARLHPLEVELLTTTIRRFAEGVWPLPYRPPPGRPEDEARAGAAG